MLAMTNSVLQCQNLEKINRRAARFVTSTYHRTSSVSNMIKQLGWQDLETRRQNFHLSLLFKIIHNQTCIPLTDITPPTIITSSTIATRSDLNNNIYQYHLLELIPTSSLLGRTLATSGIICQAISNK